MHRFAVYGLFVTAFACRMDQGLTAIPPNEAPTRAVVEIQPSEPTTIDELIAVIVEEATDPDGDPIVYRFRWSVDRNATDVDGEIVPATLTAAEEVWEVEVRAFDGTDEGPPALASVVVLNTPPEIAAIWIEPEAPRSVDELSCRAEGWDIDDHEVALSYRWEVDGHPAGDDAQLPPSAFERGQVVRCTVTPHDGRVVGAPDSAEVVIGNTPPEILSIALTPEPARTLDTLSCAAESYDADGDAVRLTYAWTVDGVAAGTGTALAPSAFVKAQEVACTVTPNDGVDDGPSATVSTVIMNMPPTAPGVAIDPESPHLDDDLVCRVEIPSTDADLDAITYTITWEVDGSAYTSATTTTLTGDTVPRGATEDGQEWTCTVTPFDGEEAGPAGSATVEIVAALDFVLFTTDPFLGSSSSTWLSTREDADAKCASEASRLGIRGSDWRIVYSNPDEDAIDFLLYNPSRADRVFDRHGTQIDGGDLFGGGVRLSDLRSWTITGTGADGTYRECSGSYAPGTWPICQWCSRKFACASATDDPFRPGACCWTGVRAIVCMGLRD